jgi:multiple RNA-binding domain-containing protein 1
MENTRVFVSGLPPSCSNDQLRNHFASRFTVTDAHVLPKRRMGFVGFKSHEVALEAVKYFNRTYMKMSKILVDLARPVRNACCQLVASFCFSFCLRSR